MNLTWQPLFFGDADAPSLFGEMAGDLISSIKVIHASEATAEW
jgi:hypothetical protein